MSFNIENFKITPLGAAIVEAMPDRKLVSKIKREFNRKKVCPVSKIFPTQEEIANFYKEYEDINNQEIIKNDG